MKSWKNILILIFASFLVKFIYLSFNAIVAKDASVISLESYIHLIKRHDSYWYERVTVEGYPEIRERNAIGSVIDGVYTQSNWAFFPLYPAMNKGVMKMFNTDFNHSAFYLSILFSLLSLIGFYYFALEQFKETKKAFFSSMVFLLFPFHYFFSMMYTEAVFFTFMIFSFLALSKRKYWLFTILIIPLALTRVNGLVMLLPLYLFYLEKENMLSKKHLNIKQIFGFQNIGRTIVMFIFVVVAFGLFCFYQYEKTGYFFAFKIAQAGWGRESMFPLMALFRRSDFTTQFNSIYSILAMVIAAFAWKKFPWSLNIMIWISLLMPLAAGSTISMPRFISVIFPLTLFIGDFFFDKRYKYVVLFLFFAIQLWSFYYWIISTPFSC